ncbi:MAG: SPOR domain-containing protein [Candidatus Kapaibacteriales bacterium]
MTQEELSTFGVNAIRTGFSANDPDDETFYLEKIGSYPGELPYEIEHTVDVGTDIFQADSSTLSEEPKKQQLPAEKKETEYIQSELAQPTFPTYEKDEIKIELEPKPFAKSGLIEDDLEAIPYEKSGLVPKETIEPFEKIDTIEDETKINLGNSTYADKEDVTRESNGIKSIWDIFEKEKPEYSEVETKVEQEFEPGEIEKLPSPKNDTDETPIVVDKESVIDFPSEIKISEYDENEFTKEIDDDFRNKILEDLEKSKEKSVSEPEIPSQGLITTSEIEDLQKELLQQQEEKTDDANYIEVDLTAIGLPQPSKIIAEEIREEPDFTIEQVSLTQPKEKKVKKEKKKKKKSESKPIEENQEEQSSEETTLKEESSQIEEQQITEEQPEDKKKRSLLILLLITTGVLAVLVIVFFLLKPLWFNQLFNGKKSVEPAKTISKKVNEIDKFDKPKEPLQKALGESKPSPILSEKPIVKEQQTNEDAKLLPLKEQPKEVSKSNTEIQQKIPASRKDEIKKSKPTISKETFAWKTRQESFPVIEIIPQREYSIEVFSTYDPDEADYLLKLLNQKHISAYIKVQEIKNANLYKVRVGNFKNLDEAKEFAKQFGFKNVWIDRIR